MNIARGIPRALRQPLLALAASLLAGVTLVLATAGMLRHTEASLQQLQQRHAATQRKVRQSGEAQSLVARYLANYRRLERQGFIGAESRIAWLEALHNANATLRLFGVDYAIAPQQPAAGAPQTAALRQTSMQLQMRLLHEDDLMRFFDYLATQQAGLFSIEECTLQRSGGADATANVEAACRLSWFSMLPGATGIPNGAQP